LQEKVSKSEDAKIINFKSKLQMQKISKEMDINLEDISDEDFQVFLDALFGPYKGGGYNPE
jgi:hypothetical protein